MRFIRITTGLQLKLLAGATLLFLIWLVSSLFMVGMQIQTSQARVELDVQEMKLTRSAGRVEAWRDSVDDIAERLEQRQEAIDTMAERYFGTAMPDTSAKPARISATIPEAAPLAAIEARQLALADRLTMAAAVRARQAEDAIRRYGLNPAALAGSRPAMGGPFVPLKRGPRDQRLARLQTSLSQLDAMERALLAIPNSAPATPLTLSSGFGTRSDPFNGAAALHAGIDITGGHGQPILAAAAGRVVSVGQQSGYGNLVVIDHGHGLETRYGHLSGFTVKPGDIVTRGQQVARMGSTGRSTGTHLHFEVRVQGRAMNPRRFLEANADVLKVQHSVQRRFPERRAG